MLEVQKYLSSGKTLEDLKEEHGVKSHVENGKIALTYDQIEAKESNVLAQQCRGLVLREGAFDIVACPMFRFFNLDQKELAATIDYSTAVFEDKLDGTLIISSFDDKQDKWCVGTRSRSEANVPLGDDGITFEQLFDMAVSTCTNKKLVNVQQLMEDADRDCTYCFELTSPFNRIVCQYDKPGLTLLAARNNKTLEEINPESIDIFDAHGVKKPEQFKFDNIEHMIQVVRDWDPKEKEGIVIRDANFNRVKAKNPSYVSLNHIRDSLMTSWRGCIEIILLGKEDDIISMMPDIIVDRILKLKPIIRKVLTQTQADYDELKELEPMKTFALAAKDRLWTAALFALKRGKTDSLLEFALGNKKDVTKIPTPAIKTMLAMCIKLEPDLQKVDFGVEEQ